jgi:hypothetical protein
MHVKHDRDDQLSAFALNVSKRVLLALACLLFAAGPAAAATYYVTTGGSDTNAGTQAAPWRTLAKANATLVAGDVCVIAAGTYSEPISPLNSGTSYRPGGMITYVGSLSAPDTRRVESLALSDQEYVSVKGVEITTQADLMLSGSHDSLSYCIISASGANYPKIQGGGDNVMSNCVVNSNRFAVVALGATVAGTDVDYVVHVERDTIRNCTFNLVTQTGDTGLITYFRSVANTIVDSTRFTITTSPGAPGGSFIRIFYCEGMTFKDCRWDLSESSGVDKAGWFALRDSTHNMTFLRDTFNLTATGAGTVAFIPSCHGNEQAGALLLGEDAQTRNTYSYCVWKVLGTLAYPGAVYYSDGCMEQTFDHCTFITDQGGALYFNALVRNLRIDHCTFYSRAPGAYAVVDNQEVNSTGGIYEVPWTGTNSITNSIISSFQSTGWTRAAMNLRYGASNVVSNNNLFYTPRGTGYSIDYTAGWYSAPGNGTPWNSLTGQDGNSIYGDPRFTSTSSVANFDPRLLSTSPAIGRASDGSDIGAFPFATGSADQTPPGVVSNLAASTVGSTNVTLGWTAPGDDGMSGVLTTYDLRWSNQPITVENFSSATPMAVQPAPVTGGTAQTYVVLSLTPGTTYSFALRAADEAGNWSGMSNVVIATTPATDQIRPGPINDLQAP